MKQNTLDLIHKSYQQSLENANNDIQIAKNLYDILETSDVDIEDTKTYDIFIDGLRNCLRMRKMSHKITKIIIYISITILYIIVWLNETRQIDIDIELYGRRKSLESDLTKLLRKSNQTLSAKILDRFGLRGVLLNKPEEQAIEYIYLIHDALVGILAAKSRTRKEFIDWIEVYFNPDDPDKAVVKQVLEIPFDVEDNPDKDYILKPKPNGYSSLHFILLVQPYSHIIPGTPLEIQLRTEKMDKQADSGSASHERYKKYLEETSDNSIEQDNPLLKVFTIDDFSKVNIPGFTSYESIKTDKHGIHHSKKFVNLNLSDTFV